MNEITLFMVIYKTGAVFAIGYHTRKFFNYPFV